jgi:hypothetical protein
MLRLMMFVGVVLLSACGSNSDRSTAERRWPDQPPAGLSMSDRKIEALIQCYKIIILAQDRYSGVGAQRDGVAATLSPARRMIEDRVIGDLTPGGDKMRVNEKVESDLQQLLRDKPYGSAEILLEGARYCAGLEERNAWREMRP